MAGREVFVTGASGFIGTHLVRRLVRAGLRVTCLVRPQSNLTELKKLGVQIVSGDILDEAILVEAVRGKEWVFHLAGSVNHANRLRLMQVNSEGTGKLLKACASQATPPIVIYTSSLAATGPSSRNAPHREDALAKPVSNYGCSKLESERIARSFADRVPLSIVRPPIVFGSDDPKSMQLFHIIDRWNLHLLIGYVTPRFSFIHVDDLVEAMIAVAERGQRITPEFNEQGLYFVAADEFPTHAELGKMIATALQKRWVLPLPIPRFVITATGAINSAINSLFKTKNFLTSDKAREATAGSWTCLNQKLKTETGWRPAASLQHRLEQIVAESRENLVQLT